MLCHEFEDQLTDYLDGALGVQANKEYAEHTLRCPICHDLLSEVKNTLLACSASEAPLADAGLEARIILRTMPETAVSCSAFYRRLCITDGNDTQPYASVAANCRAPSSGPSELAIPISRTSLRHRRAWKRASSRAQLVTFFLRKCAHPLGLV